MRRANRTIDRSNWLTLTAPGALVIVLAAGFAPPAPAQQPGQKLFSSPEEASNGLLIAVENNDESAILALLGPEGRTIVSSGDPTEDANSRAGFVQRYREMHRVVNEPDGTTTLYVGARNWPTPIPLIQTGDRWYFDTDAGKQEILFRRIGRNEISAIRVCQELAAAEREYKDAGHAAYAARILSSEGKHDGLYWPVTAGEPPSPVGPLVAAAVAEGYVASKLGPRTPYRGYYYHVLTRQGKQAVGGAKNYVVNGKMTEGFAFVAYPAEYRSSGVMTFIVGRDGVVYEKDLGSHTPVPAKSLEAYEPDSTWHTAQEAQETIVRE